MAGIICLINFVLTVVPLFYLSMFKAPSSICKKIVSIQSRFLWGWGKVNKPIAWVSWKDVCKTKEEGGLGCRDIRRFNQALLAKWRWRYISEKTGRWKQILDSKYILGHESGHTPLTFQSWWWRDLSKICKEGGGKGWFQAELGCGDKAYFWEERWFGSTDFKTLFPRLFSLSLNKGQKVGEVGEWINSVWRWRLRWRRDKFVWESDLEQELILLLSRVTLKYNVSDIQVWGKEEPGQFSVTSTYEILSNQVRGHQSEVYKLLWKAKAFPNAVVTAWRVLLDKLPTRVNLNKRRVQLNSMVCPLCQHEEESSQHLFMECCHAQKVWSMCFRWLDISFVQQNDLKSHFLSFHMFQVSNNQNLIWKGVWVAVVICIWDQRNQIIFKQGVVDAEEIFQKVQLKTWMWMKHKMQSFNHSFVDWVLNPNICFKICK